MNINVQELKRKLEAKEDFILIDVRESYEYEEFNLGAQLIPLGEIPEAVTEMQDKKDAEIIIHCRSGVRSGRAQQFMLAEGFTNVSNLEGGVIAWIDAFGS
jgi:rhodanese-related sulfurtransferase